MRTATAWLADVVLAILLGFAFLLLQHQVDGKDDRCDSLPS